jgi:hypothetical protein
MLLRVAVIVGILSSTVGFTTGWSVNGWRKNLQIADIEAQHAKQQSDELIAALRERDEAQALNARLSSELEVARSEVRTEIQYIEREVADVVQDNPVCMLGPDAVQLLNAAASGGRPSRPRAPRRNLVVEVPADAGDDDD